MPKTERRKKELKEKKPRLGTIPRISERISNKWIFIVLFIVAYGVFYFFLREKLPFTPDFGSSDAFHSNVSFKYTLWQSLRKGILPFWTDKLAGGFPLIAETQIGAFFLPHYFIFPFFSIFSHAYIFLFAFHLFLLSSGIFMLLSLLSVQSFLSFLLAVTFTWCGAISFRWVHFNSLQVISLYPWLFWAYFNWNSTQKKRYTMLMTFIVCQMIFAGHMQTTFIALLGLIGTYLFLNYPLYFKKTVVFISSIFFGILLAAPQIAPTVLFSFYSTRSFTNSYQFVVSYLFNTKDLIGFFSSIGLGSPQYATYAIGKMGDRIYWENTPYLGELFILTIILAGIYSGIGHKKQPYIRIFLSLFIIFLLLAFGGDSPLYFLFGITPFNMFRTPARYLIGAVFFLILYASLLFKEIIKKRTIISLFIFIALSVNCYVLIKTAFSYNIFIDSKRLFSSLSTFSKIDSQSHYITFAGNEEWLKIFSTKGWKSNKDVETYLFINSALLPNSNLITGNSSFDVYTGGLKIRRNEYLKSLINDTLAQFTKRQDSNMGNRLEDMLQLYGIESIISFTPLYLPHFTPVQTVKKGTITATLFKNPLSKNNLFYVPQTVKSFSYLEDVENEIAQETVSERISFAESLPSGIKQDVQNVGVQIIKNEDHYVKSTIRAKDKKFIAIKKGWYPEWQLLIDGKENPIYKTNLIHMGFYIPKGSHTVELMYVPQSFYIGCGVALLGIIVAAFISRQSFRRSPPIRKATEKSSEALSRF